MSGIVSIHNRLYTYYDLERDLQELAICYPDSTWSNIRSPADILLAATWNKRFHKACRGISGGNACKGVEKCAAFDDDGRTFSSLLWGGYSLGGDSISAIAAAL